MVDVDHRRDVDEVLDVLVIGAGQAGLALARRLQEAGADFAVVDADEHVGDAWRRRWDSLQLFTPLDFARLPDRAYPLGTPTLPGKDAVADYLADYARHFAIPLILGSPVTRLISDGRRFVAELPDGRILHAGRVAIAAGAYSRPAIPPLAAALGPDIFQLHSATYRSPADVPPGEVLVVGAGNTGAQLALELHASGRRVVLSASKRPFLLPSRVLGVGLYPWLRATRLLDAPAGGRVHRFLQRRGDAVVGTELRPLLADGSIELRPRAVAAAGDRVSFADATSMVVGSVLWATGYVPELDWVDVAGALDEQGRPIHHRGLSPVDGLVWAGLSWQAHMDSAIIHGADRTARMLVPSLVGAPRTAVAAARS